MKQKKRRWAWSTTELDEQKKRVHKVLAFHYCA